MSQLSRLIEQARKTRSVNDIFKFQPAVVAPQEGELPPDVLLERLVELENSLFSQASSTRLPIDDLVNELETIARLL